MTQTMKTATEITATAIYKVTSKATGQQCYFVPSDSQPGVFYQACWERASSNWSCTCMHGRYAAEAGKSAHCKHVAAAEVAITANANRLRNVPVAERGKLNGDRSFKLMR